MFVDQNIMGVNSERFCLEIYGFTQVCWQTYVQLYVYNIQIYKVLCNTNFTNE